MKTCRLCLSVSLLLVTHVHAQDAKTRTTMIGAGTSNVLETYLSQEEYQGPEFRIIRESGNRASRHSNRLRHHFINEGRFAFLQNRAENGDELAGEYHFGYALRRVWTHPSSLCFEAGGGPNAIIGFIYNTRNSNNPVQAHASINISPAVAASYDFHIKNRLLRLRYEASVPLAGLMFSPNYGQSYYEIFSRGDYDHNVVPTTFFSTPSLRQQLSLDIRFSRTKQKAPMLRIGYLGDYQQSKVNNLKYHNYAHLVVLGIVKTFE